jgi:uncharacterized sulfatase
LSIAGIRAPEYMQGRAFAGGFAQAPPEYLFGARGRMDARIDLVRSVTDGRYVYVRNYMPHLPHGQHLAYQMETATTRVWERLYREGKLTPVQAAFWEPKAPEELYDLKADPFETRNLAREESAAETLARLRNTLDNHLFATRDLGFVPEPALRALSEGDTPYAFGHDPERYPLSRVMETAAMAASRDVDTEELASRTHDPDDAVRYWAALGLFMRGKPAIIEHLDISRGLKGDASPVVRVVAAQAIAQYDPSEDAADAMETLLDFADISRNEVTLAVHALNAIDYLDEKARPYLDRIKALPADEPGVEARYRTYVPRIMEKAIQDVE